MDKKVTYYDRETGEIYSEKHLKVSAYFDEAKGYLFWSRKDFAKMFSDVDFPSDLSDSDIGKLTKLSKRMYSTTNLIAYKGNGGVKAHSIKTIAKLLNISERQSRLFINKMIKYGIIGSVKCKVKHDISYQYYMNPIYFTSSNRIPLNLYLLFKKQLDEILPDWVRRKYKDLNEKNA